MAQQTVRDLMDSDPVAVTTRTPFKDLIGLMVDKEVRAIPVVGRRGDLVGLVTEADLLKKQGFQPDPDNPRPVRRAYRARWARATGDCAGEVMTVRPVTIRPEATAAEAARLIGRQGCPCLPVVDGGKLIGTVVPADLLRVFLRPDDDIRDDISRRILAGRFTASPGDVTVDVASGVVSVAGEVRRKSMLPRVLATIRAVDGVVDIEGQLGYAVDDGKATVRPGSRR